VDPLATFGLAEGQGGTTMARVGRVGGLFRHPVKSMLGEALDSIEIDALGVVGDRVWAVRDEVRGDFRTGKRIPRLMSCRASSGEAGAAPTIALPDGTTCRADAPEAAARLSAALDHPVTLCPIGASPRPARPAEPVQDPEADLRETMARAPDEPMPDFSDVPPELFAHFSDPGHRHVDAAPVMILTDRSLESLGRAAPDAVIDVRRFRPSVLVQASSEVAFPEQDWIGSRLRLGEVVLEVRATCPRCAMVTHGFADLPQDPSVMRRLVAEADGNLGIYATVAVPGRVQLGDVVERVT
jgi:uncharacterized protein YcbX